MDVTNVEAKGTGKDVTLETTTGDIVTKVVKALSDVVNLISVGAISDNNTNPTTNVTSSDLQASAGGLIDLDTNVDSVTATTSAAGDITLRETGSVTLTDVTSFDGNVDVTADGQMDVTNVEAKGTSRNVSLTTTTGDVNVNSVTATGTSATADKITINSAGGIFEIGADAAADLSANIIDVTAVSGIGTTANPIEMNFTASTLTASNNGAGDIAIDATSADALSLTSATVTGAGKIVINQTSNQDFNIDAANITTSNGSITLTSVSNLNVNGNITAGGSNSGVTLTADAAPSNGSGTLTVAAGATVDGGSGGIVLNAASSNIAGTLLTSGPMNLTTSGDMLLRFMTAGSLNMNVGGSINDANGDINNLSIGQLTQLFIL